MVRSCGHFQAASAHLRLSYCNSFESVCQEVPRVNIWDAVIKEKGFRCRLLKQATKVDLRVDNAFATKMLKLQDR